MAQEWTPERRQAFADKMKASRAAKAGVAAQAKKTGSQQGTPPSLKEDKVPAPQPQAQAIDTPAENSTESNEDLKRQVSELKDMMLNVLSKQATQGAQGSQLGVGNTGKLLGEIEKYTVNFDNYENPVIRVRKEPRLQTVAFDFNYELDYETSVRAYETKTGVNMKEPEFHITLYRIIMDGQGNRVQVINPNTKEPEDKFYVVKHMRFHEDPQAALVIAREQGIDLGQYGDLDNTSENQKFFLNEMRYLRVRDWLFDVFWPKGADRSRVAQQEEVVDGTIVQTFSRPVGEGGGIDFDQIKTVMR